ncbi:MAG: tripartite tricarboxylate transporter substrate binding protein [Betaproteobacteria bacterium]|jgi:tripartite-type tricarboxylate transporter receptor subunit TctC|nr:tripartite tricarboxylate transporter substrate binding protein [Betaproteobacteria bacterium]
MNLVYIAAGKRLIGLCVLLSAVLALPWAGAQTYPSKTITVVVPFPPGGPTDSSARLIARALSAQLKQAVVVENRPGAGGTAGSTYVANAKPDGYTLLWGSTSSLGVAPTLYPKLAYGSLTSFAPLAMVARSPVIFVGRSGIKANSLKEFIALSKEQKLSYGSAGNGSLNHLVGEWLKSEGGFDMLHVPYKGGTPALNDLLSGQVDMTLETVPSVTPFIKTDKLKILATGGRQRAPQLPGVPTVREVIGGEFEAYSWVGLVAPIQTPPEVLKALSDALMACENDAALQRDITATGLDPVKSSPEKFRQDIEAELAKWTRLVRMFKPSVDG